MGQQPASGCSLDARRKSRPGRRDWKYDSAGGGLDFRGLRMPSAAQRSLRWGSIDGDDGVMVHRPVCRSELVHELRL